MYISAEGIIFRQVKAAGGRRMLLLFTKKYGKISAGSSISEKGKKRSALALRPFTYGVYELYKNKEYYNIDSADVKRSFFRIGEDVDKYMQASYILELTEKTLPEDLPQPRLFNLLTEFLSAMEKREKRHETLVLAYEVKLLDIFGSFPSLNSCARCGETENLEFFSVQDGGMLCRACGNKANDALIYQPKFDIVNILKFFLKTPMGAFEKIALDEKAAEELQQILRKYISYHLDIGTLKSESIFEGEF
mgnify:CR=1 FL=1